jgi:hypothetical protein
MTTVLQTGRLLDYFFMIPDGDGERLLVMEDGPGTWTLPRWKEDQEHFWQAVDHVNVAVREAWGLKVTTLRCLGNRRRVPGRLDCRIYEMETHGMTSRTPPLGARWISGSELDDLKFTQREHPIIMRSWFTYHVENEYASSRPVWSRQGWLARAVSWMLDQLKRLQIEPLGPVEQLRIWQRSCILQVPTSAGRVYFKAYPELSEAAAELQRELGGLFSEYLPTHLAVEPTRNWSLIREPIPESANDQNEDEITWEEALRAQARLQHSTAAHVSRFLAMGVTDRRLKKLQTRAKALLDDTDALRTARGEGLSDAEIERLRGLAPRLFRDCERLVSFTLPPVLENSSLFAGDTISGAPGMLFPDWTDAAISHPFFGIQLPGALSLSSVRGPAASPAQRSRLREAYLQQWVEFEPPDRLIEAFELAQVLAPLHYAVTLHQFGLPNAETQWEVEVSMPYFLRVLMGLYEGRTGY